MSESHYIDRPPRIQPDLPQGEEVIPPPPDEEVKSQPLWQIALPLVTILGYMFVSVTGRGSILFVLPMLLAVGASSAVAVINWLDNRRDAELRQKRYDERITEMRREMVSNHKRQRTFYEYNYPHPDQVVALRDNQNRKSSQDDEIASLPANLTNRSGSRIWERRTNDHDFGYIRVGIGTRDSTFVYRLESKSENDENSQLHLAERLQNDSLYVTDVPITLPLYQHEVDTTLSEEEKRLNLIHSNIGVAYNSKTNAKESDVYNFVHALLVHYTALHSPNDASLFIVSSKDGADPVFAKPSNIEMDRWNWTYALPHTRIDDRTSRVYFEDTEFISAPCDGQIVEIDNHITDKDYVYNFGDFLIRIRDSKGKIVDLNARTIGTIGKGYVTVEQGDMVTQGQLLARQNIFDLSREQWEAEKAEFQESKDQRKADVAGIRRYWKEKVWAELDRRERIYRDREERADTNISLPLMLIVVDMLYVTSDAYTDDSQKSWLDDVESEAALSLVLNKGKQLGASVIFLVSDRKKVPSGCGAVIELTRDVDDNLRMLYAETGLNTQRYVGLADNLEHALMKRGLVVNSGEVSIATQALRKYAEHLSGLRVRQSYGADLPRKVGLLDLYDAQNILELEVLDKWEKSIDPEWANWPKVPVAKLAGQVNRELHFFADVDGVHGMIAGSTGSGKSELLMTLILSLAIKYDPSVVNFVLVDFKGGSAFDPFKNLPHVVDIVTNLGGNAVERMFAAINAELNRRQAINQRRGVKDIVKYRRNGLHLLDDPAVEKDYYPHLFIIIDEFAEMIANNPEYKAQLDSITRLGRALGVSLILAAQRPSGVTDQMRANIKFRICLRVETKEESSELLRMPDAAYLPSIPGRGYLQVGNDSLENIQVSFTGDPITDFKHEEYDSLERFKAQPMIWEDDIRDIETEGVFEVLVRHLDDQSHAKYGNRNLPWRKPWPSALPHVLTLTCPAGIELEHILLEDLDTVIDWSKNPEDEFNLSPTVAQWLAMDLRPVSNAPDNATDKERYESVTPLWKQTNWGRQEDDLLLVNIGLVDNPTRAKSRLLQVNLTQENTMIIGGSGWGKSTALITTLIAMSSTVDPNDLHVHLLDFGTRGLSPLRGLPHVGAYINVHELERVDRLVRMLEEEIEERNILRTGGGASGIEESASIFQYNQRICDVGQHDKQKPLLVIVIDNLIELRNTYEAYEERMLRLMRNGRANGIYFIATANQISDMGKYSQMFTNKMVLKIAANDYSEIVGRTSLVVEEIEGRGLTKIGKEALEIQIALPMGEVDDDSGMVDEDDNQELLAHYLRCLRVAQPEVRGEPVPTIEELSNTVVLDEINALVTILQEKQDKRFRVPPDAARWAVIGQEDSYLHPFILNTQEITHFFVVGAPRSGKTTLLWTIILSLAERYSPDEVAMVFVDFQGGLPYYGGNYHLDQLPHHIGETISEDQELVDLVEHLQMEHVRKSGSNGANGGTSGREVFVFIDNFDVFNETINSREFVEIAGRNFAKSIADVARRGDRLHFIISGLGQDIDTGNALAKYMMSTRYGIALDRDSLSGKPLYNDNVNKFKNMEAHKGRGFIAEPGTAKAVQFATPYRDENTLKADMDDKVAAIVSRWEGITKATWSSVIDKDVAGDDIVETVGDSEVDPNIVTPQENERDCIIRAYKAHYNLESDGDVLSHAGLEHVFTSLKEMPTEAIQSLLYEMNKGVIDFSDCIDDEPTEDEEE